MIQALPLNLFEEVVTRVDAGRPVTLVTVLRATGSTPRKEGTRAMVDEAGAMFGTIGGGPIEAQANRLAAEAMRDGAPRVFEMKFAGPSAAENLPICGGTMRVLVDPSAARSRDAYMAAARAQRDRRRGVLLTRVEGARVAVQFRAIENKAAEADVIGEAMANQQEGAAAELLIEPLIPAPRLLVVGGGHVGQAVAQHAALVGFEIVLFEDRPEFADPALLPAGADVRLGDISRGLRELPTDADTYITLVSRGHVTDSAALAAVIGKPAAYLGMMGSRRKIALVRKHFVEAGLASEEELERLRAPIGLEIGAQTVPEIAASIVAELIAVRRGRIPTQGGPPL